MDCGRVVRTTVGVGGSVEVGNMDDDEELEEDEALVIEALDKKGTGLVVI